MSTDASHTSALAGSTPMGNLSATERWISAAVGFSLALGATRSRNLLGRLLLAAGGMSLLARGATGYCAIKSALSGETSLRDGMREQFRQLRGTVTSDTLSTVDDMQSLYLIELQELHSAESQLAATLERMAPTLQSAPLNIRLDEYQSELHARLVDLESLLARAESDPRPHQDDAMRALVSETHKMARLCSPQLRDAAIAASLQRIIHYKIAGYGTIAAYAKSLGRAEEAAHFAELADRDKAIDSEFSQLAKGTLNPSASPSTSDSELPGSSRTH